MSLNSGRQKLVIRGFIPKGPQQMAIDTGRAMLKKYLLTIPKSHRKRYKKALLKDPDLREQLFSTRGRFTP